MAAVSLIVHLEGGRDRARLCLEALAALAEEPSFEAVIVDDASPDLGELLAGLSGDVKVLRQPRREGFLACAVAGAEAASAEAIVLLRDAPLLDPGALGPLLEALADPDIAAAAGHPSGGTEIGDALPHPVSTHALALRRSDADCLRAPLGVPTELELAAVCMELGRRGRVVSVPAALAAPAHAVVAARRDPGERPELTVVIPTLDATARRVRACLAAIAANTPAPHQVVLVDNGSPPQGFAAPVNAGLRSVDTRYAVVMNDDVEVMAGWWEPLRAALDQGAAVAFPQTIDGAMREDFAAWCFAISEATIAEMSHAPGEFFDPALRIWFQDTDLLVRLRRIGRPPLLVRASQIRHALSATVRSEDPTLRAWIEATIAADRAAFERKHPAVTFV
jgi:GT2 family glycosyltransferase